MLFLTAGDLVSINSYVSHSLEVAEPVKYVRIIIDNKFLNRNGFDPTGIVFDELIRDETVDRLIRDMMCEIGEKSETQRMMMNSLMLHLIGHLVRNYSRRADEESIAKMLPISREPTYKNIAVALEYVSANFASVITLDELSRVCGLSKFYFLKLFKKLIGMSPIEYINNVRCGYAKQMILNGSSITEAAFASGFNSTSYFSACFKKHKGCLPSSLIDGTGEN